MQKFTLNIIGRAKVNDVIENGKLLFPKISKKVPLANRWGHSTCELIESHENTLRNSTAAIVTTTAKCVTENAEAVSPCS
jgi:hypothetical protein